jgi:hypothetical protein
MNTSTKHETLNPAPFRNQTLAQNVETECLDLGSGEGLSASSLSGMPRTSSLEHSHADSLSMSMIDQVAGLGLMCGGQASKS